MNKKWIVVGVVVIIVLFIGFNVWNTQKSTSVTVETGTLEEETMKESVITPGALELDDEQYVYHQADKGDIEEILVETGDSVKKGEPLLRYENKQLELDQEQNQLQINAVYIDLDQLKKERADMDDNVADDPDNEALTKERDQIKQQQQQANNELEQALLQKESLEDEREALTITADVEGTVLSVDEKAGAQGQLGEEAIIRIGSLDSMHVTGVISEYDTLKIEQDQSVELTSDAVPDESWEGKVSYISDLPNEDSQSIGEEEVSVDYPIEVTLDEDVDLKPGFNMLVEIITSEKTVPTLPMSSVIQEDDVDYVYLIKDGRAKRAEVQIGAVDTERMEVKEGVASGDEVIIQPSEEIRNGTEVTTND